MAIKRFDYVRRGLAALVLLGMVAIPIAAATPSTAAPNAVQTAANKVLATWIKGSQGALPTTGPKAQKGKSIWVISCGQAAPGCAYWADSVVEAGHAIGWKVTLYDDKLVPTNGNMGIEDAVVAHADGVIVLGNDCPQNEQGLEAAHAADIPVVGIDVNNCNDPIFHDPTGPNLLTQVKYTAQYPTVDSFLESAGALQAAYLLAHLGSNAKVIEFKQTDIITNELVNFGFQKEFKKLCFGCVLYTVPFTINDLIDGQLTVKAQDAITTDTEANGIEVSADSGIALGLGTVFDNTGAINKMLIIGAEGLQANIVAAEKGTWQDSGSGESFEWEAWAAVDAMNRIFAHSPQVYSGIGQRLWSVKPTHVNLPPSGQNYQPGVNFKANYLKIWGRK